MTTESNICPICEKEISSAYNIRRHLKKIFIKLNVRTWKEKRHQTKKSVRTRERLLYAADATYHSRSLNYTKITSCKIMLTVKIADPPPSSITSCDIVKTPGYHCVSLGNEDEEIRLPYFSSSSVIKRSLQLQEEFPKKVMRISCCQKESDNPTQVTVPTSYDTSWERRPYMKVASAQLLAGSLIVTDNKTILEKKILNTNCFVPGVPEQAHSRPKRVDSMN
ncbi:hypothetical protein EDC94DRAFT_648929 [Helicostylum pulchrum]|nr:hypothetical protein EDC94DRAFT_648929 [Helicostylum pulchrum]